MITDLKHSNPINAHTYNKCKAKNISNSTPRIVVCHCPCNVNCGFKHFKGYDFYSKFLAPCIEILTTSNLYMITKFKCNNCIIFNFTTLVDLSCKNAAEG